MNASTFLKNKLLDKAVSDTDFTPATNLFIRLFTTVLAADGTGTEMVGNGYAPLSVANSLAQFPASVNGAKSNANRLDMVAATAAWANILAIGIFDAGTGGNLYFYENLVTPLAIGNTENVYFGAGDVSFSIV